jgi:hypothetical protein
MMFSPVVALMLSAVTVLPPYERQVAHLSARLAEGSPAERAGAAEALGFLRAEAAQAGLIAVLRDSDDSVRRQAAMALGWCGRREAVPPLLAALQDDAWLVRQAAYISLTNLTGLEFPFDALVFLKGDNDLPNTHGTVEQTDRWRETYVVTDPGPANRPGWNLYLLRPPRPDGAVTPLTRFSDGYVAEPELSWDATQVIFTRRGQQDPWWQVSRGNDPLAAHYPAVSLLPRGDEFNYRAKAWFKGHLPPEIEERTRTVRAVNLIGR